MSKTVKDMMTEAYRRKFSDLDGAVLLDIRGIDANDNNSFRKELRGKQIRVTVVKNTMFGRAFDDAPLGAVKEMLNGPCAMAYGVEEDTSVVNVARELIALVKSYEAVEFKGAIMEGTLYGADEVERLSKFPTRDEALSEAVTLLLSPAKNLSAALKGPGGELAKVIQGPGSLVTGLVKAIQTKLESGDSIGKVA